MKCLVVLLSLAMAQSLVFGLPTLALAKTGAAQPTPTSGHLIPKTPIDKLTIRLRQQNIQISRDLKAGKLTKDQAKSLKAQVETIRKQESTDLKQNGTKTLTDAQVSQLNEQLNTLSKSIPIR